MKFLIILWIGLLILSTHTSSRSYSALKANPVDSLRLFRLAVAGAVAMWMLMPRLAGKQIDFACKPPILYMLIYGLLGLLSVMRAPSKALTAWKSIEILVDVGLAVAIAYHVRPFGPRRFLTISHLALGILVFVLGIEALLYPHRGYVTYGSGGFGTMSTLLYAPL